MKAAELMRAMETRPDMLEAAAPAPQGSGRKPDISDVLDRIHGRQTQLDSRVPALKIEQTKHSRLVPALLTACSIAACAAVVTGLAFLIRDSHEAVESSDAATLLSAGTDEADADLAAEPVTEQSAEIAESEAEAAPQTEPTDGAEAQSNIIVTDKTEPVSGTVRSEAQPVQNTEPVSADAEAPLVTAKTVPTAARQPEDETLVRITYKIPNLSILMPGMIHIELFDYANGEKISGFDLFSGEPDGDSGLVWVVIPDGTTHIIAAMYCDETNKKAEIGTFPVKVQNGAAEPIKMHIDSALNEVCTVTESPAISQPVFRTLEKYHDTPAPSFIYQWNSDQYQSLDTVLHYESAAELKNKRMSNGDRAIYAEANDGFRYLDEHADSVSYLWFMYEADGAVPEVRQMEISDQSGIWIKAALCPADVHGKVRVMIPLDEEFPAWIGDAAAQWRLELVENGTRKQDVIGTHWYWRIDQSSSIAPVY